MSDDLSMDQVLIEKLTNILEVNLDKEHFGVKELAFEAGFSRSQLHRKLKSIIKISPSRFIREFRLKRAMVMLQNKVATASEVAYRVGFGSPTYFNTCFHNYYGYPPGEVKFRNTIVNNKEEKSQKLETIASSQIITETIPNKKKPFGKRMVWINAIFILLLSVVSYNLYQNYYDHVSEEIPAMGNEYKSIAILPFKNLSEAKEDEFFTMGVTSSLQNQLNTIKGLKVISGSSMEKYTNTNLSPSEITKEINVTYLLDGSVQKYGDSIQVIIHFINARENHQLNSLVYYEQFRNLFALQSNIAKRVTEQLNIKLSNEELVQFNKKPTDNLEAYNLYLKGRFFWHRRIEEDLNKSIRYFNEALELDPNYALAYAGLADTYYVKAAGIYFNLEMRKNAIKHGDSLFDISKEYVKKTLSINKNIAEVHATLGKILCYKDWNWEASEKEFKLAIKLNPNYATGHQYYAEFLRIIGRVKEARNEIDLAQSLNPNSLGMTLMSARLYQYDGQYEKAIIEANKGQELNAFSAAPHIIKSECYSYLNMDKDAMAEWEEVFKLYPEYGIDYPEFNEGLKNAFKKSGIKGTWKFHNDRMINSDEPEKYAARIAVNLAYLGETEKALDWLDIAYKTNKRFLIYIKTQNDLKILQKEPRFLALLEKLNLGGYE